MTRSHGGAWSATFGRGICLGAWRTGATTPVVAGVVERTSAGLSFTYAESYLARAEANPRCERVRPGSLPGT